MRELRSADFTVHGLYLGPNQKASPSSSSVRHNSPITELRSGGVKAEKAWEMAEYNKCRQKLNAPKDITGI